VNERRIITSDKAPAAIGPYSQAVLTGKTSRLAFLSGQIALDPTTGQLVSGDIDTEMKQVMKNIEAILRELGAGFSSVVKSTIFLKNLGDFAKVNQIYATYFPKNPPARSTVEVSRLPREANIEIECIVEIAAQ
jgi:2-iminobutanoate/2-iminopropanoate deaminase